MDENVKLIREYYMQVKNYLDTLVIGEEHAKDVIISSMLCDKNSRILLTGRTGTAKSTISNNLAQNFISKKISITSDLLPSDILNTIINTPDLQFLQLEEANRASGRVQSSLIELLADNKITTDEKEMTFSDFYVFATQNDSEIAGIFDVPQAIYDRFDVNIKFGNLTTIELEQVLFEYTTKVNEAKIDLKKIIALTTKEIENFIYNLEDRRIIIEATKVIDSATYGKKELFASSNIRGHLFAKKIAAFHALVNGRKYILSDDISDYISNIYLHRINQAVLKMNDVEAGQVIDGLKEKVLSIKRNRK